MKSLILFSTLFLSLIPFARQDAPRGLVEAFLEEQLGRDYVLIEFTFEGTTWADTSLGCPKEGETYTDGAVPGFAWRFLLDDGLRYAVHSNADGTAIVLCETLSRPEIAFSVYNNDAFSIQHPSTWLPQEFSATEINFTLQGQLGCGFPGMGVRVLNTSDTPQDVLTRVVEDANDPSIIAPFREDGVFVTYNTACDDIQRQWRATALPGADDTIYLILQWSPQAAFPIWSSVFTAITSSLTPATIPEQTSATSTVGAITAPNPPATPVATEVAAIPEPPAPPNVDISNIPLIIEFVGDVYVGRLDQIPGIGITLDGAGTRQYFRPAPNGGNLAYVDGDSLQIISLTTLTERRELAENLAPGFPPTWTLDSGSLIYPILTDDGLEVQAQSATEGEIVLGEIPFDADCDDATSGYAVDRLYQRENPPLTFAALPDDRILYSPRCDGRGLAIWNPETDEIDDIGADLQAASLSPRRDRLAAVNGTGILLFDLANGTQRQLTTIGPPDQFGWDITGTQLFYTTLTPEESILWDDAATQERAERLLGVFPFESRLNVVRMVQVDVVNGAEILRWEARGFAVGQMRGAPDGSGLLFSFIPSDRNVLTSFANNEDEAVIAARAPETELYWLPNDSTTAQLFAIAGQPIFGFTPP